MPIFPFKRKSGAGDPEHAAAPDGAPPVDAALPVDPGHPVDPVDPADTGATVSGAEETEAVTIEQVEVQVDASVPDDVRDPFLRRLRAALRGDDEALAEVNTVLDEAQATPEGVELREGTDEEQKKSLFGRALKGMTGAAGVAWTTMTSWKKLRGFVVDSTQALIIETIDLAFKTILTVPLGVRFTGDTAKMGAFQIKAVLYYLNGKPIPESELSQGDEYRKEAKRVTAYLTSLGLRAGLFALPGIGSVAAATVGKWLEERIKTSLGDEDPKAVSEIRQLIPR